MSLNQFKFFTGFVMLVFIALATFGACQLAPLIRVPRWLLAVPVGGGSTSILFFVRLVIVWDFEEKKHW